MKSLGQMRNFCNQAWVLKKSMFGVTLCWACGRCRVVLPFSRWREPLGLVVD